MKRYNHIDFLRAAAIIGVIAIHVFSDNLTNGLNTFIWNYLHFIIVAFVFCSGYVMYALYASKLTTLKSIGLWYKKRLIRLLLPFYYYLFIHYLLTFLFPRFFSGLGLQFSWKYVLESITLIGGVNLNWLPLLFLQLAVLFPILVYFSKNKKALFWGYVVIASLTTIALTIWQFPYARYRAVMWLPWSLFLILPWYFVRHEQVAIRIKPYLTLAALGAVGYIVFSVIWHAVGRSITLIDNKYPPNLYYLSYNIGGSFLLASIAVLPFLQKKKIVALYEFISRTSYSLFFIHFILLDFTLSLVHNFHIPLGVGVQFIFILITSIFIAWLLSLLAKKQLFLQARNHFFTHAS